MHLHCLKHPFLQYRSEQATHHLELAGVARVRMSRHRRYDYACGGVVNGLGAIWSRPTPILVVFLTETSPPSVS